MERPVCGIAGILSMGTGPSGGLEREVEAMLRPIEHRGPDDKGTWHGENVCLGHRRLSIIDLSEHGHQPMISASGRYVITFNGEIYNYKDLRRGLPSSVSLRGSSDTEVLLASVEAYGIRGALSRANGMFALAVWDAKADDLYLIRDRMGEKPLYYTELNGQVLFASELKSLRSVRGKSLEVDREALALYLKYNYVPGTSTIYSKTRKVAPGSFVKFSRRSSAKTQHDYWSLAHAFRHGAENPKGMSETEGLAELDRLLRQAVGLQMVADVPLGAFLSGGVDSSLIVSIMQELSERPVNTFSIGFDVSGFNEAEHAKKVAAFLGTKHTELYVTDQDALAVTEMLPQIYCEPLADASAIPTFLLARMTRQDVTVSLSGDGGDELFGGYDRHMTALATWRGIRKLMPWTGLVTRCAPPALAFSKFFGVKHRGKQVSEQIKRLLVLLNSGAFNRFYREYVATYMFTQELVRTEGLSPSAFDIDSMSVTPQVVKQMLMIDALTFLVDDVLVKVDRATMATSLESRAPLLDHRIVEFAAALPEEWCIRGGEGKWLLKQLLYRRVPRYLVDRPKMGFAVPIGQWLRGGLRDWAEALLNERLLVEQGYLNNAMVRKMWQQHLKRKHDWTPVLWAILMFQSWLLEIQADEQART